jgi:hypothetical protein
MSENEPKTPTLAEIVKQKKQIYHDEAVRCKTLAETSKDPASTISAKSFWDWMEGIHLEIENLYTIVDRLLNSDRYAVNISKQILGLNEVASAEEINVRTKEFGELVSILVRKKVEWEQEEKQKERLK